MLPALQLGQSSPKDSAELSRALHATQPKQRAARPPTLRPSSPSALVLAGSLGSPDLRLFHVRNHRGCRRFVKCLVVRETQGDAHVPTSVEHAGLSGAMQFSAGSAACIPLFRTWA